MGRQIKTIYKKAEASFNNQEHKKKWQGGIGIVAMVVFVLSSLLFNETAQALNRAAGNGYYGYRTGTYGYNNANASSDYLPKPPTSLTTSSVATTSITLSWTAPTQTQGSTSLDNLHATEAYLIHYSTGSLSSTACSGGSTATSASATVNLSSLTANTTYNVNICSQDANSNRSDNFGTAAGILASTFTTAVGGGGSAVGGGTVTTVPPVVPVVPPGAVTPGTETGLPSIAKAAVTSFQGVSLADAKTTADMVALISPALNVDQAKVTKRLTETEKVIKAEILKDLAIKDLGEFKDMFTATLSALAEKNPQLSTLRGQEGFVRDLTLTVGKGVFNDAAKDEKKAEILADFTVSIALGNPIDRRTIDDPDQFPLLGRVLLDNERNAIKEGIFQTIFGRLPGKSADGKKLSDEVADVEWNLIKNISYRARVIGRDLKKGGTEERALVKVSISFHVDMTALSKSKKLADQFKASKFWAIIQQLGGSGLTF